ncbi:MAG: 3-methyl-2-oxobutanoate hydroxymethyltransferase [Phycisphaerae bacterium]
MRITLDTLRQMKHASRKFAMLTAYDFPTAVAAQAAGVHSLLVGDSAAMVVLGHESTRPVTVEFLVTIASAVRRGSPLAFLVGDMPYQPMQQGEHATFGAALRFRDEAGCDAVKLEVEPQHAPVISRIAAAGIAVIAHLGLRPQSVTTPDGYKPQARDEDSIAMLAADCRRMVDAGAAMILLEAVPNEASQAVIDAVGPEIVVIGCGAGSACDGHVVVTHDMLGLSDMRPPRFVPVLADLREQTRAAMRQYVESIERGDYPGPQHGYSLARGAATAKAAT